MKFSKTYTVKDLMSLMEDVHLVGPEDFPVSGMNEIHMVEEGDITFVDLDKYYQKALESKASVILIDKEVECPKGKCLIITSDPLANFNRLTRHFKPFLPSSAMVSPTAQIGEGTIVQPGAFIGNHVRIGKNCIIHANVTINDYTIIGDNTVIQSGAVIGGDACYFQRTKSGIFRKFESSGRVILGNDVEIGALTAVDRGVSGDTIVGDGTKMDNFVQIGHDTHIGKHCLIGAHSAIAGVSTLEDYVTLWASVLINKDLVIGKGAVILATSAVDKSLEGGKVYFGCPAVEARNKWKEMAAIRALPSLIESLQKKQQNQD
ncbi:MAG: UDP-3-O-(3-hydroxymyristoyl)glucosamine N-acyltransferase [Bacteroidetes bacterium]|uniref:UDP-3-O-(3-hydroxymyristoyl)glucosamine N-acyltransferase n=1 Tax=Candidatus Pullibacteroides excrementavium TaxID=2840905 RepID=A0A9D9DW14_9BACT|nr:UDP-3-O-(3-hydroxymyristoyl)glucosamine N-acyltransferase [Candidatus Pullibacteroides excrementavium]